MQGLSKKSLNTYMARKKRDGTVILYFFYKIEKKYDKLVNKYKKLRNTFPKKNRLANKLVCFIERE